ncbi:MAG: FG-GAP-like repeat-containing protein, partial [Bacteroidales bacterium]|nr:FG-GAP-like repeat-containing protein [Bacteroidales bacterium]
NSQSGDGMLGKGWKIGGFSAITRIPATLYHDGFVDGVDFDANDRFALDGQRLIAVSGSYGAHNTEYRTENETFSKIKSYYTSGNGPLKFFVETKSGIKMQYAYTENSRIHAGSPNVNSVMYWLLNKVYDTKGNYYTITYKEENGEFYPIEINYTGHNNDLAPYNKIKFLYTRKTDQSIAYVAGSEFKSTVLLSDIKIYNNEHLIRKYSFKYNFNMFSRLSEIQLYESRNSKINTTKIQWNEKSEKFYSFYPGGESIIWWNYNLLLQNDLNNDGVSDFIYFIPSTFKNKTTRIESMVASTEFNGEYLTANTGDFYGNGKNEVLVVRNKNNKGNEDSKGSKYFYLYKPEKPFFIEHKILTAKIDGHLEVGDFNGDGKTDFMFENNKYIKIYRVGANSAIHYLTFSKIKKIKKIKTADFNGDGISDIFVISGKKPYLRIYDVSGQTQNLIYSSDIIEKNDRFNLADFNGDGKTDILVEKKQNKTIKDRKLYLSTGISYSYSTKIAVSNLKNILTGDYNGDGKDDIVITEKTDNGSKVKYYYYIFNNNTLTKICEDFFDTNSGAKFNFKSFSNKSDFKYGDGKQEIVAFDNNNIVYFAFSFQKNINTKIIKSITDGYNNKTEFEFKPLADTYADVYTQGSGATFPVNDFRGALYVVKNLTAPNGIGTQKTTQRYFYESAKIHRQGKGFLGFMKLKSENLTTHIISETNFDYNRTYFNTYPISSKTYYNNTSSLISSSTITNQYIHHFGNKRIFTYPKETETTDYLTNTTVNTVTNIDYNTGNVTRTFTSTQDGTTETLYQNYIQAGAWLPTKPTKTIVNKTATGKPTYTRTSIFEYYGNGLLKKSTADPYEDKPVTTEYQYNSFGNVIHTKITSPAEQVKNSYLSYDNKNCFVISQTDPLGFTSYKTYDEETGNVLTQTDINEHTTKFKYDALGSLIETELPDGTKSYQTTNWYTGNSISNAKTYTVTSADGTAPVKTYFDILGRKIRTETQGFNNEKIISKTQYNTRGQIYKTYEPYFEGETGNYATFYYDRYGRQTRIISPTGTTLYDYNE